MSLREELEKRKPSGPKIAELSEEETPSDAAIKQGTWLTKALWNNYGWKEPLERNDIGWSEFMEQYGRVNYAFVKWKHGEKEWDEALQSLIDRLVEH